MSNFTQTTAANHIPQQVWAMETLKAFEAALVLANIVNKRITLKGYGAAEIIPKISNLEAKDTVSNTMVQLQAPVDDKATITIDQRKHIACLFEKDLMSQSITNLIPEYSQKIAYGLNKAIDSALAALATGFSGTAGTYNTTLTVAAINAAVQGLDDADVPRTNRHWVFKPHAVNDLYTLSDYMRYDGTGNKGQYASGSIGESMAVTGAKVGRLYGSDVMNTTQMEQSGNNITNMYIHKDALALCVQREIGISATFEGLLQGDLVVGSTLFGVGELRDEAGVQVRN